MAVDAREAKQMRRECCLRKQPVGLALDSVAAGAVFALWPVMWIVFAAILLYNVAQRSGRLEAFRMWMVDNLPNDRRIVLVVIGFSFGALLEGISGFGTPIAITSSLLILLGFPTLVPDNGTAAMSVADVKGVEVAGLIVDAGPRSSPSLLEVGTKNAHKSDPTDPTTHDAG